MSLLCFILFETLMWWAMIFDVRDYLHAVCALERGDRGVEEEHLWRVDCCFLNMFVLYLCPFLSSITPFFSILCTAKGACLSMLFCVLSAILYAILLKSSEHSRNWFSFQRTIKKKFPFQTPSAEVAHPLYDTFPRGSSWFAFRPLERFSPSKVFAFYFYILCYVLP